MSHAPFRRKSRQAVEAAISHAASRKPAPHLVVLRVKRKRGDAAVESLLVAPEEQGYSEEEADMPDRKRRAAHGVGSVEETLANLSLDAAADQHDKHQQQRNMRQPPKNRLCYKRVRTTEPDGSSNDDRSKEQHPSTPSVVAPPPNQAALGGDTSAPTVGGGDTWSGDGGRLDSLLSSRANSAFVSPPPRPAAVVDFMEVRRVRARAVTNARANSTNGGSPSARGGCEQQQPMKPSTGVASAVGSGNAAADFHVIDLQAVSLRDNADMDVSSGVDKGEAFKGGAPAKRTAAPILTPVERQMDEAIFTVRGSFCGCLRKYHSHVGDGCWRFVEITEARTCSARGFHARFRAALTCLMDKDNFIFPVQVRGLYSG